jgi:hypothetical protein
MSPPPIPIRHLPERHRLNLALPHTGGVFLSGKSCLAQTRPARIGRCLFRRSAIRAPSQSLDQYQGKHAPRQHLHRMSNFVSSGVMTGLMEDGDCTDS